MFQNDKNLKPRKKSYYPFSKNYPSRRTGTKYAIGESRARRKKERNNTILYAVCLTLAFFVVFAVASVVFTLSKRPLSDGSATAAPSDGQWQAVYMNADELGGGIAFDLFQSTLSAQSANAVLVDFKNENGQLCTAADGSTAAEIGAAGTPVTTAADTVARLKESGYKIIFRVYCFKDPVAAANLPGAAVTEADGVTIWLDDSARNGGNPWLNPYSETARTYLLQVINEAVEFGADMILLDGVSFPESRYIDRAYFPGEAESLFSRNAILHDFIEQAAAVAGDVPLAVNMPLSAALSGSASLYGGGIFDSAAEYSAVDMRTQKLSDGTAIGDVTYTAGLEAQQYVPTACALLENRLAENYQTKALFVVADTPEQVSAAQNAGILNYILFPQKDT
ncbi:MAG: putative glycoside hydrolase [Candidatus Fimenecus sp.]